MLRSVLLLGWIALLCSGCEQQPGAPTPAPTASTGKTFNVVFVSVDTTRADHIGCYGHPTVKTPHMDRLAAEGALFKRCISSGPVTLPAHATMMTGAYQFVHGARANGTFRVAPENVTLAELFRDKGYRTHAEISSGVLDRLYGLDQGFDSYADLLSLARSEREQINTQDIIERSATDITDGGLEFLREHGDQPFFLFLHYYDPHAPYEPPPAFDEYKHPYLGEIAYFDSEFGRVLNALKQQGLEENTLVILTSDHGEGLGQHGEMGHTYFLYDANLHVPLIVRWPGQIPAGQVIERQVRHVDLAPTILELLGWEVPSTVQGESLTALLQDPGAGWDGPVYAETFYPKVTFGYAPLRCLRTEDWKYIHAPKPELYDLRKDLGETTNVAAREPQRVAALREQMRALIAESPTLAASSGRLEMDPKQRAQLEALGYVGGSDADDVIASGDELDSFDPVGRNPRDHVEVFQLLDQGRAQIAANSWAQAADTYRQMLAVAPESPFAHTNLARALTELQQLDEAIDHYRKALALKPSDVIPQWSIGKILMFQEKWDEAEAALQAAIAIDPKWYVGHAELGRLLMRQRRFPEAVEAYGQAAELSGGEPGMLVQLGRALQASNQLDEAERIFRQVVREHNLVTARLRLGLLLLVRQQPEQGVAELEAAHAQAPEDTRVIKSLAMFYTRRGEHPTASSYYAKAVALDPKDANQHYNLALALQQSGRLKEAIAAHYKAVEVAPDQDLLFDGLVRALLAADRVDDAISAGHLRIAARPTDPHAYLVTAQLLQKRGQRDQVLDVLRAGQRACSQPQRLTMALAWQLIASNESGHHEEALALAEALPGDPQTLPIDLLDLRAAAYAANQRWDEAIATAREAVAAAETSGDAQLVERMKKRLEQYELRQPLRLE